MRLIDALPIGPRARLALVGAGGKSSALLTLARQYPGPIWIAASTHLAVEQAAQADRHIILLPGEQPAALLETSGISLFSGPIGDDGRTAGLENGQLVRLAQLAQETPLLIEADGARRKPLKAPAVHEPAIPEFVDTVVIAAGWMGVGQLLDGQFVHRPEIFSELTGLELGNRIGPTALVDLLRHPAGGLKNVPPSARKIALINQCDSAEAAAQAAGMASELLAAGYFAIIPARLEAEVEDEQAWSVHTRVAGVVLAAGGSTRMGRPKQLLSWRGKPFVRAVCEAGLAAGLEPLIVVLGSVADQVRESLGNLPLRIVDNPGWAEGQSTSVQTGLAALEPEVGAAVFLLADQPQVPPDLIRAVKERFFDTHSPVVAPMIDGRRGNPVLFGQQTFPGFGELTGDQGGRQILTRFPVAYVPWVEVSVGLDVDTEADYLRLLNYED